MKDKLTFEQECSLIANGEDLLKEKQIEEMAKEIAKRDCYFYDKCSRKPKHNCISLDPKIRLDSDKNYVTIATWLVNAGYLKVHKNSVVLLREEYEKLTKELVTEQRAKEIAQEYFGIVRKETAEKFESELKAFIKVWKMSEDDAMSTLFYRELFAKIGELAKQFGVEIKE